MFRKLTGFTLRLNALFLAGVVNVSLGMYGFVLFMLPAVYRLGVSFLLIGVGATCLFVLLSQRKKVSTPSTQTSNPEVVDFIHSNSNVNDNKNA